MSFHSASDGPADEPAPFACDWRPNGIAGASARVTGELDPATAPRLEQTLHEALEHARLVVLNVRELSFVDSSGLQVLLNATKHARQAGAGLVLAGVTAELQRLLDLTGTRALMDIIPDAPPTSDIDPSAQEHPLQPLNNPVNARVVTTRVMDVAVGGLWSHDPDGTIRRAWAPASAGSAVPAGADVEVYLDYGGAINGWWHTNSNLAINQRHLGACDAEPTTATPLACQGPCGLVWQAPASAKLTDHGECCLTCAGALAPA